MRGLIVFFTALVAVSAHPGPSARIVGGALTTINLYPEMASLLFSTGSSNHRQACGGVVITNRAILTAAFCTFGHANARWRVRLGSSYANSGGSLFNTNRIINHPQYNSFNRDNDLAIIHVGSTIRFSNTIRKALLPKSTYSILDNQIVWAAGWGATQYGGAYSEQLRHVQMWTVNLFECRNRYSRIGRQVTDNMFCAGYLNVGGRDQCTGDYGGPVYHNGNVIGVTSWGQGCGLAEYPGVNTRLPRYQTWIGQNQ